MEAFQKEVKSAFSSGQSTADFISFESIDRIKVHSMASKAMSKRTNRWQLKRRQIIYWLMCSTIGIMTGIFAFLSSTGLGTVQRYRIQLALDFLHLIEGPAGVFCAWFIYATTACVAVVIGSCLVVFVQPAAKGAGIAEVKAFLNGVTFDQLFSLKTLGVKLAGTICSVGAGLPMGQEGPMIHIGAMLAWNISQMKYKAFPKLAQLFRKFQNDRDKRDFVSSGAAFGVAAAFSAPIGGTLFAIEEAASFWSHSLIWRSFFGCMLATWMANFLISGVKEGLEKSINDPSHVMYSVPLGAGYKLYEIPPFLLLGVIGGLSGSLFIKGWKILTTFKKKYLWTKNHYKVMEIAIVALIIATLQIGLTVAFGCQPADNIHTDDVSGNEEAQEALVFQIFNCKEGEYNQMASLWFTSSELALKHMFVRSAPKALAYGPLITFCLLYYLFAMYCCGTWVPGGLLVPMLVIGAAYGRVMGLIVNDLFPGADVDPGIYSVLGAASFMGGVSRMTVSLVVIMIEITNDLDALLPIMLVCMVAKWVGDMFCHSIYDEQLHFNHIPFLEPDPPKLAAVMLSHEAMQEDVVCLPEVASVEECAKALSGMKFSSIPVIDKGKDGNKRYLKGSIPRTHLALLLYERTFEKNNTLVDVMASERRFKKAMPDFVFSEVDGKKTLDLSPYVNMATFWVYENFPLNIAYRIFRENGLRQLFVVDYQFQLKGMITRKDLLVHEKHGVEHHQKSPPTSPNVLNKEQSNLKTSFKNMPFRASSANLRASSTNLRASSSTSTNLRASAALRQPSFSQLNVKPTPTATQLNLRQSTSQPASPNSNASPRLTPSNSSSSIELPVIGEQKV